MWTAPRTWVTGELVTASLLNTHLKDNLNALLPLATMILRAAPYTTTETAVEGRWLQCNGVAVSRTTYSVLFSYLNGLSPALPFGTGDGSTTFNIPDLRGRTPYAEGEHADVDDMGDNEGQAIATRGPSHFHNVVSGNQTGFSTFLTRMAFDTGIADYASSGGGALNKPSYQVVGSWFIKYTS